MAVVILPTSTQRIQGFTIDMDEALIGAEFGARFLDTLTGITYEKRAAQNPGGMAWIPTSEGITSEDILLQAIQVLQQAAAIPVSNVFKTAAFTFGDIITGAAYADLDAMGSSGVAITVPRRGVIQSAVYYDLDNEGLQVDLWLFGVNPPAQTDNSAFAVPDINLSSVIDVIQFIGFRNANTGFVSTQNSLGIAYDLGVDSNNNDRTTMYAQLQARGALNIAAGSLPQFQLKILT